MEAHSQELPDLRFIPEANAMIEDICCAPVYRSDATDARESVKSCLTSPNPFRGAVAVKFKTNKMISDICDSGRGVKRRSGRCDDGNEKPSWWVIFWPRMSHSTWYVLG